PKLALPALQRGLHVWIEKPPAASVAELRPLLDASRQAHAHVVVGLKKMFMPANRKAAALIRRPGFDPMLLLAQYPQTVPTPEQFAAYLSGRNERIVVSFLDHLCHPV